MSELAPEAVPATPAPVVASETPTSVSEGGTSLNVSHVAGGGFGAVIGAAVAGLVSKFAHVHVSDVDAALIGSAAVSAGVGLGHAIAKGGVVGLFRVFVHGSK